MQHAITIGDLVWWSVAVGGIAAILAIAIYILAAFGRGMSR